MVLSSLKAHTIMECRRLAKPALDRPDPLAARSAVAEAANLA
jgi:hypothetical protein